MTYHPDIPTKFVELSDGASVPLSMRRWIVSQFGQHVMDDIDICGVYHDYLAEAHPHRSATNRAKFILYLGQKFIDHGLVKMIDLGLTIYDYSPKYVKLRARSTAEKTDRQLALQPVYNVLYSTVYKYFHTK